MASNDSILLNKIGPYIDKALSDKRNINALKEIVANYLDENINKLTTNGPIYRTFFMDNEYNKVYNILSVSPAVLSEILKESSYIKGQWQIMNNPFNSVMVLLMRYGIVKKDQELLKSMSIYFTLSFYPTLHTKYFKFEPNTAIMDYTIANMSSRFKIKQTKTWYHAMIETTEVCNTTYEKNLIRATDKDITDFVHAYKTRLNALIKTIAIAFYENEKNGAYLNETEDVNSEDEVRLTDNDSLIIERIANSVVLKLSTEGPDMRIVTLSAKACSISVNELRTTTFNLAADSTNREDIKYMVTALLYVFIFDKHKGANLVSSNDFYYFSLQVYSEANTTNENVVKIKEILDKWLSRYSVHYNKTNRVGTLNNFRRALYTFMVFTIQQNSKK